MIRLDVKDRRPREENSQGEEASAGKKRSPLLKIGLPLLLGFVLVGGMLFFGDGAWQFVQEVFGEEEYEDLPRHQEELEEFITNPASPGAANHLRLKMHLGFNEGDLKDELEERNLQVRNRINVILRSKTVEDLQEPGGTESLQREIKSELNNILVSGQIEEIYFEEFIIQ